MGSEGLTPQPVPLNKRADAQGARSGLRQGFVNLANFLRWNPDAKREAVESG